MNAHDSEKMAGILKGEGYERAGNPEEADLIIYNTCSIRQKAEQKFYSHLGRVNVIKRKRPDIKIVVAGCIAQQEGKNLFNGRPYLDALIGPRNISKLSSLLDSPFPVTALEENNIFESNKIAVERNGRVKALINIMYGCNNYCSYCIVPYTRGREKSRSLNKILSEATALAEDGYKEVTLLGQNVNSYRGECSFPELLKHLDKIPGLERIRFITSHPKDFNDELIDAVTETGKVCEHIHLPLQSGSSRILNLMNRKYTYSEYLDKVNRLCKSIPHLSITTDIITGFPSETSDDHQATVKALKEIEFDGIFAFKYSPRPNTAASAMNTQVDEDIKSERLAEILAVQDVITEAKNKELQGKTVELLIEESGGSVCIGRTRTNKIVTISSYKKPLIEGTVLNAEITRSLKHSLEGSVL